MKLSFEVLEVLDAIDRTGTFARAAKELHKVPSSLSYLVQKLEEDLNVQLFDRSGHRAKLTPTGKIIVEEGRRLLLAAHQLERKVARAHAGWETDLRIAVNELIPFDVLWPEAAAFYGQHPDTQLHFSREVLGGTWDALVERRADLVVGALGDPPPVAGLVTRPIGELQYRFVVSPSHPLADAPEPLSLEYIARYRAVVIADTSHGLSHLTRGLVEGQDILTVPTLETKRAAQIAGLGCGTIPACFVTGPIERGELVAKQLLGSREVEVLHLAWREDDEAGRALRWWTERLDRTDFVDYATQQAGY